MKTYHVALKYTAWTNINIEAESQEEAERLAWQELASDGSHASDYGDWTLESIGLEEPLKTA